MTALLLAAVLALPSGPDAQPGPATAKPARPAEPKAEPKAAARTARPGPSLLAAFEKKVTEHRLQNGWRFLIIEKHDAPVVSFFTHVDVGSAQERYGITGLAHMFEHMAFKGTAEIGTRDPVAEKAAIEKTEAAFRAWKAERMKVGGGDPAQVKELEQRFRAAEKAADDLAEGDEFGRVVEREGGVGLNAFTNSDETGYIFSLPSNKLELWAYLESERFLRPVFRQFYKERDVVKEERRMRTESSPFGRLLEQFRAAAFSAHPYGHPVVGHMSDLDAFTLTEAEEFYRRHYVPSNMVTAIIGDVRAAELVPLLEAYFGRIPAGEPDEALATVEPEQGAERRVAVFDQSQPIYIEGYHVPPLVHPDAVVLDAAAEVLGRGRTSRLYRDLVRDRKLAAQVQVFAGYPGLKYPTLFVLLLLPTPGHTAREMGAAIRPHLERLRSEPVSAAELSQVKSRAKADLVRQLDDDEGLAQNLATWEARSGDWRDLFRYVERIEAVTPEDIRRVADRYFRPENRTVGMTVKDESEL